MAVFMHRRELADEGVEGGAAAFRNSIVEEPVPVNVLLRNVGVLFGHAVTC